jgi:glycosyltransferase involved in cell wall biosynthesis
MRILHVIPSLDPATGGPPLVASRLADAQARLGHELATLSYTFPEADERTRAFLAGMSGQVRSHVLPPLTKLERFTAGAARRYGRGLIPQMDVVHLHGVWDPIVKAAGDVARQSRVPYVLAPHGMLDPWSLGQSRLKKRLALALGYRRLLDGAAFLHMLNVDERALIGPLGLSADAEIIPNGVALDEIEPLPARGAFRAKFPRVGDRPFVLFLSRLHYKKGLDYLAGAFHRVAQRRTEVDLVVAGPDGGARADFEQRIAGSGLGQRVHIVGPLYGTDKIAAFVDAACFCLPSRQEGFSVAILEALACGTPVVASTECHFPEVAEAGAGHVVPLDEPALAAALESVLALDPAARDAMGRAGQQLVRARYVWPRIAEASIAAYERAIARAKRGA